MKIAVVLVVALALAVVVDARTHANRKPSRHAKNAHRAELEEKVQKMSHIDIKGLEERVAEADLDDDLQYEAAQNIAQIKKNKKEMKSAEGERAGNLATANELRLRALDLTLGSAARDHEEEGDEDDEVPSQKAASHKAASHKAASHKAASHKVAKKAQKAKKQNLEEVADVLSTDLDNLRSAVNAEKSLPKADRKKALDNIMHMESDIEKYADTNQERFKKAFKLRSQVLRKLLAPSASLEEEAPKPQPKVDAKKVHNVEHDVANLKKAIKAAHLSSATRKDAEENLAGINADAEQLLRTSSADVRSKLNKAINLRVQALKRQLEQ